MFWKANAWVAARTRVNALGPVTSHAEQAVGYEHFGTNFAQHAFSRLSSFDLNNSAEGTSQLIGEFIQSGKFLLSPKLWMM